MKRFIFAALLSSLFFNAQALASPHFFQAKVTLELKYQSVTRSEHTVATKELELRYASYGVDKLSCALFENGVLAELECGMSYYNTHGENYKVALGLASDQVGSLLNIADDQLRGRFFGYLPPSNTYFYAGDKRFYPSHWDGYLLESSDTYNLNSSAHPDNFKLIITVTDIEPIR